MTSVNETQIMFQAITPRGVVQVVTTYDALHTLLQRALNTWSDPPKEILEFSDQLDLYNRQ